MNTKSLFAIVLGLVISATVSAQRPPRPDGGPGAPGRGPGMPGQMGRQDGHPPKGDWLKAVDTNQNGTFDNDELQAATERTFAELDRSGNGTIDDGEGRMAPPPPPAGRQEDRATGDRPEKREGQDKHLLPPFFFMRRLDESDSVSKSDFTAAVRGVFNDMDKDHDGVIGPQEARPPRPEGARGPDGPEAPGPPPNAQFIAAELRFGDRLVKGQPFSAEAVIEDTRRLYDGSTATKSMRGAIYRDSDGRTRREQPLEMVGGVNISGSDGKPQMMVFINDFATRTQTFLDVNNKVARTHPTGDAAPHAGPGGAMPKDKEKTDSLGSKTIEGVKVDGTRTSFEIPAGQLGNDKPIEVVTENWFSPELQVIVMSRHIDPIAGEHIFRLVNIKRAEPSADLFAVPNGYRVEGPGDRRKPE
jgi:hypothetical protein